MTDNDKPPLPFGGEPRDESGAAAPNGDAFRDRKRAALIALIASGLVFGALDVWLFGDVVPGGMPAGNRLAFTVIGTVVQLFIGFAWLRLDAIQLDIRRPGWLNVGIIMAAVFFVPYYLFKTRPAGRRSIAMIGFLGVVIALMAATSIGASVVSWMPRDAATATTPEI